VLSLALSVIYGGSMLYDVVLKKDPGQVIMHNVNAIMVMKLVKKVTMGLFDEMYVILDSENHDVIDLSVVRSMVRMPSNKPIVDLHKP
jgi:hypothetical protein